MEGALGLEFWPVPTLNSNLLADGTFSFGVQILNPNSEPAHVTIEGGVLTAPLSLDVDANSALMQGLPWVPAISQNTVVLIGCPIGCCDSSCCRSYQHDSTTSAVAVHGAYHLRSSRPVQVLQFNPIEFESTRTCAAGSFSYSNDATLVLPSGVLGGDYLVLTHNAFNDMSSFVTIVATHDDTHVLVTPTAGIVPGSGVPRIPSRHPQSITLGAGDVAQLLSDRAGTVTPGYFPADLTGTSVSADHPIEVIAGVDCTFISGVDGLTPACDHLEQSIPPIEYWSTSVMAGRFVDRGLAERSVVRVLSSRDGNRVHFEPATVHADVTIDRSEFVEFETSSPIGITASEPVLVGVFMEGQETTPLSNVGDPSFMIVVPSDRFETSYVVNAPESYTTQFVQVIARQSSHILTDGVEISPMIREAIAGTGWEELTYEISPGTHRLSSPDPFGAYLYGVARFTSYATPLGFRTSR